MARLRGLWLEIVEQFWQVRRVLRLQREINLARRLQRRGEHADAYRIALCTFAELSSLTAAGSPHASALLSTYAVFLDELATQMGQPGAAREPLQQALAICEEVLAVKPKLEPTLQKYIAWYKHRLTESAPVRPN